MGARLGLRAVFMPSIFAFEAKQFPFYAYGGAIRPAGAGFMPSILLLQPNKCPFYSYGAPIRPAGTVFQASIHLFGSSIDLFSTGSFCSTAFEETSMVLVIASANKLRAKQH